MLLKCPECELPVSDKAQSCPHCGNPMKSTSRRTSARKKTHMRLPNGFGQITYLKNRNLRNPYRAMITVGKTAEGRPICKLLKPQSYFATYNDAYTALVEYNKNPYDLDLAITVKELYEKWTAEYFPKLKSESSERTIKSAWAHSEQLYNMNARDVRARHIKGCIDAVGSPNIKSRIKSLFNLMLDYAEEHEIVDKNYARTFSVEGPAENNKDHIAFTEEEMKILWDNTSIPLVNAVLLQSYSGWRPQELCEIKLTDVNWDENIMHGGMKTDAGFDRDVPIHSIVLDQAKKLKTLSEMLNCEYLLCDNNGKHMSYDKYYKRFVKLMKDLNLNPEHRPHDPRKTFVTKAKKYKVDEFAIKRMIGHKIDDLTERVYTERSIDWLKEEIEKIEK